MASESVATATKLPTKTVESVKALFGEHPDDVLGDLDHGSDRFYQLAALFQAIAAESGPNSTARKLAQIGKYVADDAANFLDAQREGYVDALIKASKGK